MILCVLYLDYNTKIKDTDSTITQVYFIESEYGFEHIEAKISDWLYNNSDIDIVDIKIERTSSSSYSSYSVAMITYRIKSE